jgi:hypothetical protein
MNKVILLLLCIVIGGCYTTMTTVFSSYDLAPRDRVERQPKYYYEASPFLPLNDNLSIRFYQTASRSLAPVLKSCEESMSNSLIMIVLTDQALKLDLNQTKIISNGKYFKVNKFKPYGAEYFLSVSESPMLALNQMKGSPSAYAAAFKSDPINTKKIGIEEMTGVELVFDDNFSCGENNYEMIFSIVDGFNNKMSHKIYFFPWKSSLTPH